MLDVMIMYSINTAQSKATFTAGHLADMPLLGLLTGYAHYGPCTLTSYF